MNKFKNAMLKDKVAKALREAVAGALAADPGPDGDFGTCNLDSPTILVSLAEKRDYLAAADSAGVLLSETNWLRRKGFKRYFVRTPVHGQANRRSIMAEAAHKKLLEKGLDSLMYYQMD